MICVCRGDTKIETKKKETFVRDKKKGDKRKRDEKKATFVSETERERETGQRCYV